MIPEIKFDLTIKKIKAEKRKLKLYYRRARRKGERKFVYYYNLPWRTSNLQSATDRCRELCRNGVPAFPDPQFQRALQTAFVEWIEGEGKEQYQKLKMELIKATSIPEQYLKTQEDYNG